MNASPPPADDPVPSLAAADAEVLLAQVVELSQSSRPLHIGLRACAGEASSPRLTRVLNHLADQLERGASLPDVLQTLHGRTPAYISGLLTAAARTGRIALVLSELTEFGARSRQMWRSVMETILYPLVVLLFALAITVFAFYFIVPPFEEIFREFELGLPFVTLFLVQCSHYVRWILLAAGVIAASLLALRVVGGAVIASRFIASIPVFGMVWFWTGVAEFARLLSLLVRYQVPLPEALKLTSAAVRDAHVGRIGSELAVAVGQGQTLHESLSEQEQLPALMTTLARWGEQHGALDQALLDVAEILEGQVLLRATLLRSVLPALLLIVIFFLMSFLILGLFTPLLQLIQGLA